MFLICLVLGACGAKGEGDSMTDGVGTTEAVTGGETEVVTGGAEETHVVLTGCGAQLSCEVMTVVIDIMPSSALECAENLYDNGKPGLVSLLHEVDGDSLPPYMEDTILMLADGRVVRQRRERDCGEKDVCEDGPWKAWGPHEICEVPSGNFDPEANISNCMDMADWTCEQVLGALML